MTPEKGPHGAAMYESTEALPLIYQMHGPEGESDRDKLLRCQAEAAEMRLQQMRGELIPVQEITDEIGRMVINCRSRFLFLPTKLPPILVGCNETEIHDVLHAEVYEALTELANGGLFRREENDG